MSVTTHDFSGVITLTAPTGGVTEGTLLSIQDLIVLPLETADATDSFQARILNAHIGKIFKGVAAESGTGDDWVQGEAVYWDDSEDEYTTVATGNNFAGWAFETKAAATETGTVIAGYGTAIA